MQFCQPELDDLPSQRAREYTIRRLDFRSPHSPRIGRCKAIPIGTNAFLNGDQSVNAECDLPKRRKPSTKSSAHTGDVACGSVAPSFHSFHDNLEVLARVTVSGVAAYEFLPTLAFCDAHRYVIRSQVARLVKGLHFELAVTLVYNGAVDGHAHHREEPGLLDRPRFRIPDVEAPRASALPWLIAERLAGVSVLALPTDTIMRFLGAQLNAICISFCAPVSSLVQVALQFPMMGSSTFSFSWLRFCSVGSCLRWANEHTRPSRTAKRACTVASQHLLNAESGNSGNHEATQTCDAVC